MSKLTVAVILGLGMLLPLSAMAGSDDEVTIRVMHMNENTSEKVLRYIELPDAASDEADEQAQSRDRNRERVRERENQNDPDPESQEALMEQERERLMEHEHLGGEGGPGPGNNGPM